MAGVGHHGAVVHAQGRRRIVDLAFKLRLKPLAQAQIGADAAGDDQMAQVLRRQRSAALDEQGIHRGFLESPGDVRPVLFAKRGMGADAVQGEGLEAAEAEVQARPVRHGPRKAEAVGVAMRGAGRNLRTARIAQPQHLGGLVKGFANGVVQGLAKHFVAPDALHLDQLGVAAGDQQGNEGQRRRLSLQQRGQQMRLHVMHRNGGNAQAPGQSAPKRRPNQQGAVQPGTSGVGNAVQVAKRRAALLQGGFHQGRDFAYVVPRGQLRHHAAEGRVPLHLAVQQIGQQAPLRFVEGYAGFIAGGFDSKHKHERSALRGQAMFQPCGDAGILRHGAFTLQSPPLFSSQVGSNMPHVRVRENEPFDVALRRFKRSCEKAGILSEVRRREFYEKPTSVRKRKAAAAVKRHHKKLQREARRFERIH